MMPWLNIWNTAPLMPSTDSVASPSSTMPMCDTDE